MQTEQEEEMWETKGALSFEENKSYKKIVEIDLSTSKMKKGKQKLFMVEYCDRKADFLSLINVVWLNNQIRNPEFSWLVKKQYLGQSEKFRIRAFEISEFMWWRAYKKHSFTNSRFHIGDLHIL